MQTQATRVLLIQDPATEVRVDVPAPPAPPAVPGVPISPANARATYLAKAEARNVLGEQLDRMLNRRENLLEKMQDPSTSAAERAAIEPHLAAVNARIIDLEAQIQRADMEWATAAAVPGAAQPDRVRNDGPPEEMLILGVIFTGIAMCLVAGAWARRLVKGTGKVVAQIPTAFEQRFTRLEQSLDAVAIEVERISEGQRFLTRVFADPAQRPAVAAGERVEAERYPQL